MKKKLLMKQKPLRLKTIFVHNEWTPVRYIRIFPLYKYWRSNPGVSNTKTAGPPETICVATLHCGILLFYT